MGFPPVIKWLKKLESSLAAKADASDLADTNAALALKADLADPVFTGMPTAPTAKAGTRTKQIATTEFVDAALAGLSSGLANQIIITSSGLWIAPKDGTYIFTLVGGGGSGGGIVKNTSYSARAYSGAGGGGAVVTVPIFLSAGQSVSIIVGDSDGTTSITTVSGITLNAYGGGPGGYGNFYSGLQHGSGGSGGLFYATGVVGPSTGGISGNPGTFSTGGGGGAVGANSTGGRSFHGLSKPYGAGGDGVNALVSAGAQGLPGNAGCVAISY